MVEVTTRTQHGRLLLTPRPDLNEIVLGVLGRAQRLYGARVCALVFLSNHAHLLLRVDDARQLADFMRYVNSNLAREVARLVDWHDAVWSRRYQAIVVSEEEEAQVTRLTYLLAHGVKENLVAHPADWPGVQSVRALSEGGSLFGYWFDRTSEYFAHRGGEDFDRLRYATRETLVLSPLPCWEDTPEEERRARVARLVEEIVERYARERAERRVEPLGVRKILRQKAHDLPLRPKQSPAPHFHTATREAWAALRAAYRAFLGAFRLAAQRLRAGEREVPFPLGCFPPPLPFVGG